VAKVAVELDRQAQRDLRKLHPDDHRAALHAMADVLTYNHCRPTRTITH
jgi:hypothetical protein